MMALNPKSAIASQIAAGRSVADMAKSMGVSTQTIYRRIEAFELQLPRRRKYQHVPNGRDLMRELEDGATIAQLSEKYDVVEVTLRNRIKKSGYQYDRARGWIRREHMTFSERSAPATPAHLPISKGDR